MKLPPDTTPWQPRVRTLIMATGWTQIECARRLGFKSQTVIQHILRGGRPKARAILRLMELEKEFAGEIEAYKDGRIGYLGGKSGRAVRWDLRVKESERPEDLAAVGAVGTAREEFGPGPRTPKLVQYTPPKWGRYARHPKNGNGRPTTAERGQGSAVAALPEGANGA